MTPLHKLLFAVIYQKIAGAFVSMPCIPAKGIRPGENRPLPRPPENFNLERFTNVHWHQGWDVFEGVRLPGRNSVEELCGRIGLPDDLSDQGVLDIGAWNGGFSFECERRGAKRVVALSLEDPNITGFNILKDALSSKVEYRLGSVYSLTKYDLGKFDIILFFGVLYHLRYPILAIDQIRTIANRDVYIETHVIDRCVTTPLPQHRAIIENALMTTDVSMWQFYPTNELEGDPSNWFGPNCNAVRDAFTSAGFSITLLDMWGHRAAFKATVAHDDGLRNSYEGISETLQRDLNLKPFKK